jgi:hypothetical protein
MCCVANAEFARARQLLAFASVFLRILSEVFADSGRTHHRYFVKHIAQNIVLVCGHAVPMHPNPRNATPRLSTLHYSHARACLQSVKVTTEAFLKWQELNTVEQQTSPVDCLQLQVWQERAQLGPDCRSHWFSSRNAPRRIMTKSYWKRLAT